MVIQKTSASSNTQLEFSTCMKAICLHGTYADIDKKLGFAVNTEGKMQKK